MKYAFLLSKEDINLSKEEAVSLIMPKRCIKKGNLLIFEKDIDLTFLSSRLALTRRIYRYLFACDENKLKENMKRYDWQDIYRSNFCIRIEGKTKLNEKELAGYVWNSVRNPKVNLNNPKTSIEIFIINKIAYCCLLKKEINHEFNKRKSHNRPEPHPSSLNPKLAMALINLTGIMKGKIIDPMCGSGGILIEAGLAGLKPIGYDIDQIQLNRAKINLDYYKIKDYKLIKKDALKIKTKINYIICDLPYGRNTKAKEPDKLYNGFLKNLKTILKKRAVIAFPVTNKKMNYESMIKKNRLKIINRFNHYLHKSLSKRIYILE